MTRLIDIKSVEPKLKQNQMAKKLGCSSSTLQRYRHDINLLLPCSIPSNSQKRKQKISNTNLDGKSNREHDLKKLNGPQMNSKDLKRLNSTLLSTAQRKRKAN